MRWGGASSATTSSPELISKRVRMSLGGIQSQTRCGSCPDATALRGDPNGSAGVTRLVARWSETITVLNDHGSQTPEVGIALVLDQPGARGPPAFSIERRGDSSSAAASVARVGGAVTQASSSRSFEARRAISLSAAAIATPARRETQRNAVTPIASHVQMPIRFCIGTGS
jgi:hypothetical protein